MGDIYGATNVVLQTLGALVSAELSSHSDLRNDVIAIQNELQNILGYLMNAEERAEGNDAAKDWVRRVRVLAYDIEDAIERYQLYLKRSYFSKVRLYILREVSSMASTIKSLRENATIIAGARDQCIFTGGNVGITITTLVRNTETAAYKIVVDDNAKREIIDLLGNRNPIGAPSTTAVVGMRGFGKTTVVNSVYYDDTIRSHFPLRAWIPMSQCRQEVAILRSMISQFSVATNKLPNTNMVNSMDERPLLRLLKTCIQGKRYIIVFDNVKRGDISLTPNIKCLLHSNELGSKILITTRYEDVARAWLNDGTTNGMYKIKALPSKEAWELFCINTFQRSLGRCPKQLEKLARGIVKKCGGLPPVITSVGSLLSNKEDDLSEWSKVRRSLGFYLDTNHQLSGINKNFMQSYYDLPFYIKPCFLYFGLFPRGYPISGMRLIRLWIAEGFIRDSSGSLTLEEVAAEYMNELINMSMIEVISKDSSGKLKTLGVVNKFIHEMILSKLDELSFCKILSKKGSFGKDTSRRLSIYKNYNSNCAPDLEHITKNGLSIRSLFVEDVESTIMVKVFNKAFLKSIGLLKVLDLSNAPIDHIPEEVGMLLNLHYLSLRNTRVSRLPRSIAKLENLQTLDFKQTFIIELPKEFKELRKLRHILGYYFNNDGFLDPCCMKINGVNIQEGVLRECLELQKLAFLDVNAGHKNWAKELRSLRQLRKLGILGLKLNEGDAMCSVINEMKYLQALNVFSKSKSENINLMNVKSPPLMLKRLYLNGPLVSLPTWIHELHSLVKIRLRWSNLQVDPLQMLQVLPNLVELQLLKSFTGEHLKIASHGFQKLKVLHLLDLHPLKSLIIAKGSLPLLDEMSIGESKHLEVPSTIKYLSTITKLNFYNMPSHFTDRILPGKFHFSIVKHIPSVLFHKKDSKGNLKTFTLQ
ncbi:disease resistance protein RPM1-like [Silene latifolia]|uniref:disease resistance protein RPM1-like n=1 Tax=Silene latifolia TaxID=37657 RepID=UPI003D78754F